MGWDGMGWDGMVWYGMGFSDAALAAFVSVAGGALRRLSVNSVRKVQTHMAL